MPRSVRSRDSRLPLFAPGAFFGGDFPGAIYRAMIASTTLVSMMFAAPRVADWKYR